MNNLEKLNQISVVDFSISGGELEYVLIEDTEENRSMLREMGMSEEDEDYMVDDGETIDIAYFAFNKLGATYWSSARGFLSKEMLS